MILKINAIGTSKAGKVYGKTVLGKVMHAATGVELVAGQYAVVTNTVQTMRKAIAPEVGDAKGLVLIDGPKPILNIVQATFPTKEAAIEAIIEEQSGDLDLVAEMQKIVKDFSLDDVKALSGSAI